MIAGWVISINLSLASAAMSAAPARAPVGRWVVEFADQQCVASLNYGSATDPMYLAVKPSPLNEVVQISILRKTAPFFSPAQLPAKLQIDDRPPTAVSMLAIDGEKEKLSSFRINLSTAEFALLRQAKKISFSGDSKIEGSFQLVQMQPLAKVMDECLADLRQHWNIEPTAQAKLKSRAKANIVSLFSTDDFPRVSLDNHEGGTVAFVLLIDEQGKVADCTVTATSGRAALDAQACSIMLSRARFVPATGADGKPAKDATVSRVRWEIPQ